MHYRDTFLKLLTTFFMVAVAACGGGGGGNDNPTSRPDTFYVRASGDDVNSGTSPEEALRTIVKAVSLVTDGDMIIVGPGKYVGMVELQKRSGTSDDNRIVLVADPSGTMTGDPEGNVTVEPGEGEVAAFQLTTSQFVTIDGFTVSGARSGSNGAGIIIRSNSNNAIVRNCQILGNRDGIRIQDSSDVLVFNNLIADGTNRGIRIAATRTGPGSQRTQVINNTVANNRNAGIVIGDVNVASRDSFLRNNIIQNNRNRQIDVTGGAPSSVDGYDADFNLVFPDTYGPFTPPGENDVNEDARFVREERGDYHLDQRNSPAVDAGDPSTDAGLRDALESRSTSSNGDLDDNGRLDLGYHFPA